MKKGLLLFYIFFVVALQAQKYNPNDYYQPNLNISGSYYWGTIFKHSTKFEPDVTQKSHAFEVAISKVTKGDKEWQRKLNYPEIGGAIVFARFGDNDIFGNAIAVIPYAKIWLKRTKIIDWYFRGGLGLGYITKPFDYVTNPTNNVIGSKINNCTQLSMGIDYKVNKELTLFTGLNFTHFSNASFQTPNLGINYVAFSGGFRYLPNAKIGGYNQEPVSKPIQKNFFKLNYSMAFYEYKTPGGPKYPIYVFTGAYARATSINNRIFTGLLFEHDIGKKEFLTQYVHEPKMIKANNFGLFIGNEIFLGRVSLDALVGTYILKAHDNKTPIFAKLGLNYHAYKFGENKEKSLVVNIHMKTHYFVAQYFDVGIGINL